MELTNPIHLNRKTKEKIEVIDNFTVTHSISHKVIRLYLPFTDDKDVRRFRILTMTYEEAQVIAKDILSLLNYKEIKV